MILFRKVENFEYFCSPVRNWRERGDRVYKPYPYKAKRLIKRYPIGKIVKVYCNPLNNNQAILEPGIKIDSLLNLLIVGILILVIKFSLI